MAASLNFQYSPSLSFDLSASNIPDRGTDVYNGNGTSRAFNDFGRRFTLGATARFE